jgi:hypothetical protein
MNLSQRQIVNNTAGAVRYICCGSDTNDTALSFSTNRARLFARSRNADADTHSQVPTFTSDYTACAPHP